jgi:hypothetical protein
VVPPLLSSEAMRLELRQEGTSVSGEALLEGRKMPLADARLVGSELTFRLAGRETVFRGKVTGATIDGMVELRGKSLPWRANRGG